MRSRLIWRGLGQDSISNREARNANQLDLYGSVFGELTADHRHGGRIEVEIDHQPWNELSTVRIHVPSNAIPAGADRVELLRISRLREDSDERLSVEITGIAINGGAERIETERGPEETTIFASCDPGSEVDGALDFEFVAWELVTPVRGNVPYLVATLGIVIELGEDVDHLPVVILLKTPRSATPRSTQGNHTLAYPSRTDSDHRVLAVYYAVEHVMVLRYTSGESDGLTKPWEALGRSALSAALVFFIASSAAADASSGDRFLALLAAAAAAVQVSWDAAREVAVLNIYGRSRGTIPAVLLAVNCVLLLTFAAALLALSGSTWVSVGAVRWFSFVIAVVAFSGAVVGVLLHRSGAFHGYKCDFLWCGRGLGLRRRRRAECRFTGRVYCDFHLREECSGCAHGQDLGSDVLATTNLYSSDSIRCLSPQRPTTVDGTKSEGDGPVPTNGEEHPLSTIQAKLGHHPPSTPSELG